MPTDRPAVDVSGRPLRLRDVDIDTFLHPKTIAVIGASEQSAKPNTAMTRKFAAWAKQHGATFYPGAPDVRDGARAHVLHVGRSTCPATSTSRSSSPAAPIDTFEEVLQRKAKFAVIFAAGFSETGTEGEKLEAAPRRSSCAGGDVRLLGPNTNLNAFEDFRADLEGPSIALITQSGHQGRPVFQGQEIGIRLTHWAPTGNEVDLEFADFARYFADQPEVGVIACYIEGFKDGRTLMLAADHAAQLRKPIVMVKVGKTAAGQSMAQSHTGHLTGSDAVTSAVFRQFGVTRVDGSTSCSRSRRRSRARDPTTPPAWAKREATGRVRLRDLGRHRRAHGRRARRRPGLRIPDLTKKSQQALHDGLIPAYLRVSNPVDCGGPPVADARGRKILDVILADKNVDILVIPITGAVVTFREPFTRDIIDVAADDDEADLRRVGRARGHRRHVLQAAARRRPARVPHVQQLRRRRGGVRRLLDVRGALPLTVRRPRRPTPSPAAKKARKLLAGSRAGRGAVRVADRSSCSRRTASSRRRTSCARRPRPRCSAANAIGFPVVMKVSSPDLLHKSDAGRRQGRRRLGRRTCAPRTTSCCAKAKKADRHARIDGVHGVRDGDRRRRDADRRRRTDELFGPVVTFGLGGIFVEVFGDVTFRVPPFDEAEARRALDELKGYSAARKACAAQKPADIDALVDTIMKVQRLAMDLAGDVRELDINPLVVRPRGAVALDALVVKK